MKTVRVEFFSESRISLDREIRHHPELQKLMDKHSPREFELRLLEVATYCNVILHGDYLPKDFDSICERLRNLLLNKRTGLILN